MHIWNKPKWKGELHLCDMQWLSSELEIYQVATNGFQES